MLSVLVANVPLHPTPSTRPSTPTEPRPKARTPTWRTTHPNPPQTLPLHTTTHTKHRQDLTNFPALAPPPSPPRCFFLILRIRHSIAYKEHSNSPRVDSARRHYSSHRAVLQGEKRQGTPAGSLGGLFPDGFLWPASLSASGAINAWLVYNDVLCLMFSLKLWIADWFY